MIRHLLNALGAALLATAPASAAPSDTPAILDKAGFKGFALIADQDKTLWQTPRERCRETQNGDASIVLCHPTDPAFRRWPWASITKQVLAIMVMKQVDAGRLALETPASTYLPALGPAAGAPTIRQLLQHRAGLRNPEDSAKDTSGMPGWYREQGDGLAWCLAGRTAPGGDWRYNNCDSLVLGAILQRLTGMSVPQLFARDIAMPLKFEGTAFSGTPADRDAGQANHAVPLTTDEQALLARYGAAGGLVGTPLDLLAMDRALLAGRLLSPTSRDEMWKGDPKLGFMGLAQWSFSAPLKGCRTPVRIIERRGAIGRFQSRNILLPDANRIVILFTAEGDFDFGEIWEGKGLSHDLLAAAACPSSAAAN